LITTSFNRAPGGAGSPTGRCSRPRHKRKTDGGRDHKYKIGLEDVPLDEVNYERSGSDNMRVRWIVTRETMGASDHVVGVTIFPPSARHHPHRHPYAEETQFPITGSGIARVGDTDIQQGPGDTVFVPRDVIHGFWNNSDRDTVMIWTYGCPASLAEAGFVRAD